MLLHLALEEGRKNHLTRILNIKLLTRHKSQNSAETCIIGILISCLVADFSVQITFALQ